MSELETAAPLPAPMATPAAQPPSIYQPTKRDEKLADICEHFMRGVFVTTDKTCSLLRGDWPEKIH